MLEYELTLAPHERTIIRQCIMTGTPYPKKIANAPVLAQENQFFYNAFFALHTTRNYELGPIPFDKILLYCDVYEIESEQRRRLIRVLDIVDNWVVAYSVDVAMKAAKSGGKSK